MNKKDTYVIIVCFLIIIGTYVVYNIIRNESKEKYETTCYDCQNEMVERIYKYKNDIFEFDNNGIAKVTIEKLLTSQNKYGFSLEHDKEGNDCIGYYIIYKKSNNIEIDSSHICDMINY